MTFLKQLHLALIVLFALINGMMLYLFLLNFPYGIEPFLLSFKHWQELSPQVGYVLAVTVIVMGMAVFMVRRIGDEWKNRLLFFRWRFAHPAFNAFLTTRKQPFESAQLLKAFPQVKDAGFSARVQIEVWEKAHQAHAQNTIVLNTETHWLMLRDLYMLALIFLGVFLLGWLVNLGVPFAIVATYVFLFGAQVLFLLLAARRIGLRVVDNVLGVALGVDDSHNKA